VIRIGYADLPEGLHVEVRSEGATTVIYLAPTLTRTQRRAALGKARQAARVGRSARLPVIPYTFAIWLDKIKTTVRAAAAAARVHPVGFAVPTAIVLTAVVLYTFVTSVTLHLVHPPQAHGAGQGQVSAPRGAAASPSPGAGPRLSVSAGGPDSQGGSRTGHSGSSDEQSPPSRLPNPVSSDPQPSSPNLVPSLPPSPLPSPLPTGTRCVQVGPLQVCVGLRA